MKGTKRTTLCVYIYLYDTVIYKMVKTRERYESMTLDQRR